MARETGLEPATSTVTGWYSNQLSYSPALCNAYYTPFFLQCKCGMQFFLIFFEFFGMIGRRKACRTCKWPVLWYGRGMKTYIFIFILTISGILCAAPPQVQLRDSQVQLGSGITVVYRAGTSQKPEGLDFLRELDREVSRLFRAPPGTGACRIIIDRAQEDKISFRMRGKVREILLPENFHEAAADFRFRGQLAGELLGGRYGLQGQLRPLPGWIVCGLEGMRQNANTAGRIVRVQQYYPVLRGLMGVDCMPDFRALMQLEDCEFTGSAGVAVLEFGRFLLETFVRLSSVKNNALGDYTAEMLRGIRREPDVYRATLLQAMTSGRRTKLTEAEFFRIHAERAAFNHRTPRPAEDLLKLLPEKLKYEIPSRSDKGKILKGNVMDIPAMMAAGNPDAVYARMAVQQNLQRFFGEFSPELLAAGGALLSAVAGMSGGDPEAECAAILQGRQVLEKQLKDWSLVEKYLEECEQKFIRPGVLFRSELSTMSDDREFLTPAGKEFFDQVEKKYLGH